MMQTLEQIERGITEAKRELTGISALAHQIAREARSEIVTLQNNVAVLETEVANLKRRREVGGGLRFTEIEKREEVRQ